MSEFGLRAYEMYKNLGRLTGYFVTGIPLTGYAWAEPMIHFLDYNDGDELLFEWWHDNRKVSIYVDAAEIMAMMIDLDTEEMPDMLLETLDDFVKVWIWLHQ